MAIISSILDVAAAAGSSTISTGRKGYNLAFGIPKHALALTKGYKIADTQDLTQAFILGEVQKGNIIPLTNAKTFVSESGEDTINTDDLGVDTLGIKGLPKFMLTYKDGNQLYKEIAKMEGYANYDFIFGDYEGNWKVATEAGYIKGFDGGQVVAKMTSLADANTTEEKGVSIQLTDRDQYDKEYSILVKANVGWHIRDLDGVNACTVSFNTAPAAGTTVVAKVLLSDNVTPVSGLVTADFLAMVDGATNVITGAAETGSTGVYTITVTDALVAAESIVVSLYDSSENADVVILASAMYRGETDATVVS